MRNLHGHTEKPFLHLGPREAGSSKELVSSAPPEKCSPQPSRRRGLYTLIEAEPINFSEFLSPPMKVVSMWG